MREFDVIRVNRARQPGFSVVRSDPAWGGGLGRGGEEVAWLGGWSEREYARAGRAADRLCADLNAGGSRREVAMRRLER